ncbi:unnamed protein product [Gadus morhua 'NCC']
MPTNSREYRQVDVSFWARPQPSQPPPLLYTPTVPRVVGGECLRISSTPRADSRMEGLLLSVVLCTLLSLSLCYDSQESTESFEDVSMSPNQANSFFNPYQENPYQNLQRNYYNNYNQMWTIKSPAETCEDYSPCRFYAFRHGFQQAYQRYFGSRNPAQTPVQAPVRSPVRSPFQAPIRNIPILIQSRGRNPVRNPVRSPVRNPVRSPVRNPVRGPVRGPVRNPVVAPPRSQAMNRGRSPVRNLGQNPVWNPFGIRQY